MPSSSTNRTMRHLPEASIRILPETCDGQWLNDWRSLPPCSEKIRIRPVTTSRGRTNPANPEKTSRRFTCMLARKRIGNDLTRDYLHCHVYGLYGWGPSHRVIASDISRNTGHNGKGVRKVQLSRTRPCFYFKLMP